MATSVFKLDERLEGDSLPVCELPLCTVRLMRDARFPWLLLVPRCADASEIIDLEEADRETLMREIALASHALRDSLEVCDKINIGSLGNMVPQLHVHVIARVVGDAAWPGPVWGVGQVKRYTATELERTKNALVTILPS